MKLFNWIKRKLSHQSQAVFLYRRGMLQAKLRNDAAAVADYTAVVEMTDARTNVRAMALYNRALVYAAHHDDAKAIIDLEKLLEMPGAAGNVKTEARRKLARMHRTSVRLDERSGSSES